MAKYRNQRPQIGVTGPTEGGGVAWFCARLLLWFSGGRAVRINPHTGYRIEHLHGVILGGGADIDPARYKETLLQTIKSESKKVSRINLRFLMAIGLWLLRKTLSLQSSRAQRDLARDELEFGLLQQCVDRQIPVLGICRGGQLINVFWGGSLHQSIKNFYIEQPQLRTIRPRKWIQVEAGTTLARIISRSRIRVNSLHDQSVKDLGKDLRISARESNGVVQAIEHRSLPFMVGVQWHPEFLPLDPTQRRFFRQLVQAARVHRELCPPS